MSTVERTKSCSYDQDYTREERYPDLMVHGPLQALLMG